MSLDIRLIKKTTMNRKQFIKFLGVSAGTVFSLSYGVYAQLKKRGTSGFQSVEKIRFGVITDVHMDFFPEAKQRLEKFISEANAQKLDFIVQLGDFTYPKEENRHFLSIWNRFKGPKYHVLGNHDMDKNSKASFLDFVGQQVLGNYYSFDRMGFHFVVLDNNYIRMDQQDIPYEAANYKQYKSSQIGYISTTQVSWLKNDLAATQLPTILFSHQPLNGSVGNSQEILEIIKETNKDSKKIIGAFSGHLHHNWHLSIDDVHHVQLNSASYLWVGDKVPPVPGRYPKVTEEKFKLLPKMAPYDNSLFAIVEIDNGLRRLNITGRKGGFVSPSPYDLGYFTKRDQMSPSSSIDSRSLIY